MIKVVNFCGGRGSNSIVRALLKYQHVRLTNVINAYDDGKSTGAIRRFFRMLGPSDIRKNQIVMMNGMGSQDAALASLVRFRFPADTSHDKGVRTIESLLTGQDDEFHLTSLLDALDQRRRTRIRAYLSSFLENVALYERVLGEQFPYTDCSLANCMYAGAFEVHDRDFDLTVSQVGKLFNMRGETITNSGENRHLVAIRENGLIMNSEAEIVESRANVRIHDIYIVDRPLTEVEKRNLDDLDLEAKIRYLQRFSRNPVISSHCADAVREADIIVYSPGTQHSSLYPTYMTRNIGELIRRNSSAMKVFVANIGEDYETPAYSVSELVEGALKRLKGSDSEKHPSHAYIHYVLANNRFHNVDHMSKYIRHDPEEVERLGVSCISSDFEDRHNLGKHDGEALVKKMFELLDHFDHARGTYHP
jgi:2-phospho-L-lactate transferase/gluconeogenesis factor (CofD/UPF0052 family)